MQDKLAHIKYESPFTYRVPVIAQQPTIKNAQQPYPYIANGQQPNIRNKQSPFTYQYGSPFTFNSRSEFKEPYIGYATVQVPGLLYWFNSTDGI